MRKYIKVAIKFLITNKRNTTITIVGSILSVGLLLTVIGALISLIGLKKKWNKIGQRSFMAI